MPGLRLRLLFLPAITSGERLTAMSSTRPKFFCEFCGTEVKQNDRVCTHCGKFFASVRCPSCGFTGVSKLFRDGCPACGYAVFTDRRSRSGGYTEEIKKAKRGDTDPLPWWIYLVSVLFVLGVFILILLQK